eukprot:TRINITY_DN123025_c0_g1_i1.p1 TRINITY_DN123025_c0_g1~~TRINITY_DN123025_c0_g1_i1.p1  ORF type:complete len:565 (-),score=82.90 TRINITY_DN123025_c0_g1_i1:102-1796(-)
MESSQTSVPPPEGGDLFADLIAPADPEEFWRETWQKKPQVFRGAAWSTPGGVQRPMAQPTWADCCDMLLLAWGVHPDRRLRRPDGCELLIFKGRAPVPDYDTVGPCEAILDGASCVVNHSEYVFEPFWKLCNQLRRHLVHVYCNSYVTPPVAQTAPLHADDRDVFVVQLCGKKHWKVYGKPPYKFPYSHEQAGKDDVPIPREFYECEPLIECDLEPGDVLYMPRGYLHEACCPGDSSSWHATLAVATHDWSWTKIYTSILGRVLDQTNDSEWKAAMPLSLGVPVALDPPRRKADEQDGDRLLQELLQDVQKVTQAMTAADLREAFTCRIEAHNERQTLAAVQFVEEFRKFYSLFEMEVSRSPSMCFREEVDLAQSEHRFRRIDGDFLWLRICDVRPEADLRLRRATDDEGQLLMDVWGPKGKGKGQGPPSKGRGKGGNSQRSDIFEEPSEEVDLSAGDDRWQAVIAYCSQGAGTGQISVRQSIVNAVNDVLAAIDEAGPRGFPVADFAKAVKRAEDKACFDDLTRTALARTLASWHIYQPVYACESTGNRRSYAINAAAEGARK